ncbi:MAG: LD-carboxypeptidase [Acidobacteriota bacterium]
MAAVSGPVDSARLTAGVAALEARGYRVVLAENVGRVDGFLAGTDRQRADGYRRLLADPSVDAIFFARGGYGASRILGLLDPAEVAANPKIHLGGSDLTALLAFVGKSAGLVTFYGPMVAVEMSGAGKLDWEAILTGATPEPHVFSAEDVLSPGRGEGPLVGGCLSLLASMAGTPEAVSGRDSILFWEDTGEAIYRIDRLLTQLERSDTLDGLRAMVIGSVVPAAGESPDAVRTYLRGRFDGAPFPVAFGLPAGHLAAARTLPLGAPVTLEADAVRGGRLVFGGPAVR